MITHSPELAKKFLAEIKKTRATAGKPGKNRSCVISEDANGNPLVLISKKKPTQAAALAKTGALPKAAKNLLVGQIFWEEGEFRINVTKGNQNKGKILFRQYFIEKNVTLPTKVVNFIELPEGMEVDFEEDQDDDGDVAAAAASSSAPADVAAGPSQLQEDQATRAQRNFRTVQALVGKLPANDDRARRARGMLVAAAERLQTGDISAAVDLMTRIAVILRGPAAAPQPADSMSSKGTFSASLRFAQADVMAARAVEGPPQDSTELGELVRSMVSASKAEQFEEASRLSEKAHKLAIKMLAGEKTTQDQRATFDKMGPVFQRVEATYLSGPMINGLENAQKELKGGTHFKALVAEMTAFQANRSVARCEAISQAADAFLAHQENDLIGLQRNSKAAKLKKAHAESARTAARHMKMALELKALGAPPWDEQTAMKATGLYAAFDFETTINIDGEQAGTKGDRLGGAESGISASFWVRGRPAGSDPGTAATKEFLFKPARGEQSVPGFPRGGSAPREALSKLLADNIRQQTGLDLGVPATNLVAVAPEAFDTASYNAALQKELDKALDPAERRRLTEKMLPTDRPSVGSLQQFMGSDGELKGKVVADRTIVDRIPVEDTHRAAVLDILTLNCDRHPGNFMVTTGDTPHLIPIDHGLTFPSGEALDLVFSQKLNNPCDNVLLAIPGSFEPFSEDTARRLEMLDPAALMQGTRASIANLDAVHPDFGASGLVPDEAVRNANRAATVLKGACRRLSPAMIQILLGTERARIFKSTDAEFEESLEALISQYEHNAAAITQMVKLEFDTEATCKRLRRNQWHDFLNTPDHQNAYREWAYANPQIVVEALTGNARAPASHVKPPAPPAPPAR